jgi:uncharacterized protein
VRSHLLEGTVRHRRARPFVYVLDHRVNYLALDLDEIDEVGRLSWLIGRNQRRPWEMRDSDHLVPPASDLRAAFLQHLRTEGVDPTDWRITLVANPRVLGYVFNPASFYLCRDPVGELQVVVVEVHNTHGERHLYTLRPGGPDASPTFMASMDKAFYVSPFIGSDGGYTVRVRDEPSRLRITINHALPDGLVLHASLDLVRRRLTHRNVLRMLVREPLVTHKTTAMIHWHALRLWLRGAHFHRHRGVAP